MALARLVALALVAASTLVATSALALDTARLASATKPSVVLVSLYDAGGATAGWGTGFFVTADGKLVTNHHVIDEAGRATVSLSDGRVLDVKGILVDDAEHDIAIVQVKGGPFPVLPIGDTASLHAGEEVAVVGSPLGLSTTISTGIVAAVRGDGLSKEVGFETEYHKYTAAWGLQITAPIAPGSSGSPILNAAGEVVGVAVGQLLGGQNLNFGISTVYVKAAMTKASSGVQARPLDASPDRKRNLAISAAAALVCALLYVIIPRVMRRRAKKRAGLRGAGPVRPR